MQKSKRAPSWKLRKDPDLTQWPICLRAIAAAAEELRVASASMIVGNLKDGVGTVERSDTHSGNAETQAC